MEVTVIGAGYVGLVTAVGLAKKGHQICLVEQNQKRLTTINSGKAPFHEAQLDGILQEVLASGKLTLTQDLEKALESSEVSFVAVGTPSVHEDIDLSQIKEVALRIGKSLRNHHGYHVVVVKSTVVPSTTDTVVRALLEENSGLSAGQFGLCMNPEFLREGSAVDDFLNPDRIIIGQWDERSGKVLALLYSGFQCPVLFTSLRNAELTKYCANSLLSVLISFSNEFASLCEAVEGTDIDVIMEGLHLDKRLSPVVNGKRIAPQILSYLRAGCGFGGSCLPKDVNALRSFAHAHNVKTPLLDAAKQVNDHRAAQVVSLLAKRLGSLAGKTVAVFGLAFKPDTDDIRESPALRIIDCLKKQSAHVRAYDPMISAQNELPADFRIELCDSPEAAVDGADAAVIATAWSEPIVLDGRRLLTQIKVPPRLVYVPIGVCNSVDNQTEKS
jgi:UDPglucose 6-dehydrogenase